MSRYIDAEILLDAMRHITLGETDVARSEMKIVHYICHMPYIADVRENVRGEWIEDNSRKKSMMWRCSVCGRIAYYPTIGERKNYKKHCGYNFCPNCGAEMRGDNNGQRNEQ